MYNATGSLQEVACVQRVDRSTPAHRGLVDRLVGAVRDSEPTRTIRKGRDAELGIPPNVQDARAHHEPWRSRLDHRDAPRQRRGGGVRLIRARRGLQLQHLNGHIGADVFGGSLDRARQALECALEIFLRIVAAVDGEPGRPRLRN